MELPEDNDLLFEGLSGSLERLRRGSEDRLQNIHNIHCHGELCMEDHPRVAGSTNYLTYLTTKPFLGISLFVMNVVMFVQTSSVNSSTKKKPNRATRR